MLWIFRLKRIYPVMVTRLDDPSLDDSFSLHSFHQEIRTAGDLVLPGSMICRLPSPVLYLKTRGTALAPSEDDKEEHVGLWKWRYFKLLRTPSSLLNCQFRYFVILTR